jgi:hypothetical protein
LNYIFAEGTLCEGKPGSTVKRGAVIAEPIDYDIGL